MRKLMTICLMLLGVVAQAQNFAITATTEAIIRKNVVKGNAANYGFGMINDTLRLIGLNSRYDISTGSFSKNTVSLGNVDNTSDANKPVSFATQTALNLKANIASPTFTGSVGGITKSMVGLSNVDNTTDANKIVSTPTQTALDAKQATLSGTGFVKSASGTITYDNSTYLSTSAASSTYLPISNPTSTGTLTAPTIANSLGANFATTSGNVGVGTASPNAKLDVAGNVFASGNNPIVGGTTGVGIGLTGGYPQVYLRDNTGATDTKTWDTYASGTIMYSRIINDASSNAQVWQQVQRSGATVSLVSFPNGNFTIGTTANAGYKLDVNGTARVTGTTQLNGNVGIGAAPSTQSLNVYSSTNDIAFQAINAKNTGSNFAVAGTATGVGGTLNMGGYFYADGAASNHGIRVYNITAAANNYSLFIDSPAKSYFQGSVLIGTTTDEGYKLTVSGIAQATQFKLSALNTAPASSSATGTVGEIKVDANYIYICTATNTWKRSAITTW